LLNLEGFVCPALGGFVILTPFKLPDDGW